MTFKLHPPRCSPASSILPPYDCPLCLLSQSISRLQPFFSNHKFTLLFFFSPCPGIFIISLHFSSLTLLSFTTPWISWSTFFPPSLQLLNFNSIYKWNSINRASYESSTTSVSLRSFFLGFKFFSYVLVICFLSFWGWGEGLNLCFSYGWYPKPTYKWR